MPVKLTLSVEEKVVDAAKTYARKQGKSLSRLVENYLKSISGNEMPEKSFSPQILKLMGSIKLPDGFDYKKELVKAIAKKAGK